MTILILSNDNYDDSSYKATGFRNPTNFWLKNAPFNQSFRSNKKQNVCYIKYEDLFINSNNCNIIISLIMLYKSLTRETYIFKQGWNSMVFNHLFMVHTTIVVFFNSLHDRTVICHGKFQFYHVKSQLYHIKS